MLLALRGAGVQPKCSGFLSRTFAPSAGGYKVSPRIRKRGFLITRRFESESSASSPKRSGGSGKLETTRRRVKNPDRSNEDRKSTRLNSSHVRISYAVFCLKKKNKPRTTRNTFHC